MPTPASRCIAPSRKSCFGKPRGRGRIKKQRTLILVVPSLVASTISKGPAPFHGNQLMIRILTVFNTRCNNLCPVVFNTRCNNLCPRALVCRSTAAGYPRRRIRLWPTEVGETSLVVVPRSGRHKQQCTASARRRGERRSLAPRRTSWSPCAHLAALPPRGQGGGLEEATGWAISKKAASFSESGGSVGLARFAGLGAPDDHNRAGWCQRDAIENG